ncbi:MAG: hypothetical protein KDA58_08790 [Planctomycetaceae bacterium]|nr:hypothetical protein [Planctomycetaceae bacterium]
MNIHELVFAHNSGTALAFAGAQTLVPAKLTPVAATDPCEVESGMIEPLSETLMVAAWIDVVLVTLRQATALTPCQQDQQQA